MESKPGTLSDPAPVRRSKRRTATAALLAAVAVACALAALIAAGVIKVPGPFGGPSAPVATDLNGKPAQLEEGEGLSAAQREQQKATAAGLGRLQVPSVGLDVPLGQVNAVGGVLVPPGFTSAYQVRNLGVPLSRADSGTVYVVMHSLRNGGVGPGNYLFDVSSGASRVHVGDEVTAGDHRYRVDGTQKVLKSALSRDRDIWTAAPGRLTLITCLQRPTGGPSVDNFIVTAQLVS